MRQIVLVFMALALLAAPAQAQDAITLDANPVPIVEAEINGRPVRLEVDLRFPRGLALSREAAERLRVMRLPIVGVRIGIEGSDATLAGRIARPRLVFDGEEATRAFSGVFPAPVSTRADGVIGPGVLPFNVVTVRLGPEPANARDIVFPLEDADDWEVSTQVGGETLIVRFDPSKSASIFNRPAARLFDHSGAITSTGDVAEIPLILGLSTLMQPVETALSVGGLSLRPAYARTNAPLLGATEEDAVVVTAEAQDPPPPNVTLGRDALSSCSSISVDRRARRLTLRCAA
jgi:hypothetical protein